MIFPIKVMACENTIDFLVDDEDLEEIYKYKNWIVKNDSADYSMGNSQNVFNATSRSQSGLQNVYFLKHLPVRPYMVLLRVKDKIVHQKYFASIEDAKLNALQARKKYYEYSQEAINAN